MKQNFIINDRTYRFEYEEDVEIGFSLVRKEGGISLFRVCFTWKKAVTPKPIVFSYTFPCVNMYTAWDPYDKCRDLNIRWPRRGITESRLASGMPLKGLISKNGNNAYLLAVSDVKCPLSIKFGISDHDEPPTEDVRLVFFTALTGPFSHYEAYLRIDERGIPFDRAVGDARAWFTELGYPCAHVPQAAKQPMYSTWYSYEKAISADDVIRECEEAVRLGMKTVILDDGWQTDAANSAPFYAYCGDWEPSGTKFPDMRGMVDRVHELGMKVMLWFPVPYIGYRAARHTEFEGRYLCHLDRAECSVLDPRYPSVRRFLVNTYVDAVTKWGLDGLKLDFIDRFATNGTVTPEMDLISVEDAVERLLGEITTALRAIRDDILIEFRQPYFGPVVSAYGNMMRVMDCPLDPVLNKNQTLNLRLISEKCAVHADMMYWDPRETPEGVAVQLLGTLFSVPQISVHLDRLSSEHRAVLTAYLDFWNAHRETLCDGTLQVRFAENGYSYAAVRKDGEKIALASARAIFEMEDDIKTGYLFNITDENTIILRTEGEGQHLCEVFDCMGTCITPKFPIDARLSEISVPHGGMMKVTRNRSK